MPPPWVAGAECRIVGELHGSLTVNVFHFATNDQINDPGTLDELLLQLAQAMLECAVETLLPGVTQDWKLVQVDARRIYPAASDPIVATAPAGSVGARGPTSVSFASTLVNLRTGAGGKRGRGRKFLPPAGEADTVNSTVDNAVLLLIAEFLVCLAGKFLGANPTTAWRLGVFSPTINTQAVGGGFDNAFHVVSSMNPKADVAVIRSRRKGRGA